MNLRKTAAPTALTWASLSRDEQNLLTRLCLEALDGIRIVGLERATLRVGDTLLERELVEYRDLVIRVTEVGLRLFVLESGLVSRKAVG